ncbi:hypothetical protein ACFC4I_12470 [Enterococcus durans]|uniref:hypothetical protein n=1 Tax=Enterococcus durans TaxID=53345 RepID=UPI0035D942B4
MRQSLTRIFFVFHVVIKNINEIFFAFFGNRSINVHGHFDVDLSQMDLNLFHSS